jgi:hypothetical protein
MLSKKAKYALQALLQLAKEYDQGPTLISELARREGIPKKFLELILLDLKRHGILQSKKGKGGGYFLGKKPPGDIFGPGYSSARRSARADTLRQPNRLHEMPGMQGRENLRHPPRHAGSP